MEKEERPPIKHIPMFVDSTPESLRGSGVSEMNVDYQSVHDNDPHIIATVAPSSVTSTVMPGENTLLNIIRKDQNLGLKLEAKDKDGNLKYVSSKVRNRILSSDGKFLYHISIIDYLQKWNFEKACELASKVYFMQ